MARTLLRSIAVLALIAALGFGLLWNDRAQLDYNSEGRYFDEGSVIVYDESGVLFFGLLALASIVLALIAFGMDRLLGKAERH
jgi:hypothetical protein